MVQFGQPYMSTEEFRLRTQLIEAIQDSQIQAVLVAASRQVDGFCGRRFDQTESEARVFTWDPRLPYLALGDVVAVSEVAIGTDGRTWTTSISSDDYALIASSDAPFSGVFDRLVVYPPSGLPYGRDLVQVTANWGWPEPPSPVAEATFLMANRLKSTWTAPWGVTGTADLGSTTMVTSLTPLIQQMIIPYRVITI